MQKLSWLLAVGCALTALGCSGSSGSSGGSASTAGGSTATAFRVLATTPTDGAQDVPVDDTLYVTLSEDVDPSSLVGAVTLISDIGPVSAQITAVTPRVLSVDPDQNMTSVTNHLLRLTTGVTSSAGTPLGSELLVKFKTDHVVPIRGGGPSAVVPPVTGPWQAGVGVADMTPPVGVPLAGFGGGDRRQMPPDLNPFDYDTFLTPSKGIKDPVMAKALVLDNGTERVCIVTLDAIATEANMVALAHQKAAAQGFSVPLEKVLVCSSHTHSGPGAVSRRLVWQVIAADLYVDRVAQGMTNEIAQAMLDAEANMVAASVGVGNAHVTTATRNRRAADSPDLNDDSIDPELLVIRVDRANGTPLATVWNFGVHGTHFGDSNLDYSADIMGSANMRAEAQGAGVCLFINGAEGDVKPKGDYATTGQLLADTILAARQTAQPQASGILQSVHEHVDMGDPYVSLGLRHLGSNIQANWFVNALMQLGVSPHFDFWIPSGWIEREFRYQAIRVGKTVVASMPGEPIHEIGLLLKQDGKGLGFDHVIPAGLANGHGSYFTTAKEYGYGGYEGMASMFGPQNGDLLMDACRRLMDVLKP